MVALVVGLACWLGVVGLELFVYSFVGVAMPFELNPRCHWFVPVPVDPPRGVKILSQIIIIN